MVVVSVVDSLDVVVGLVELAVAASLAGIVEILVA